MRHRLRQEEDFERLVQKRKQEVHSLAWFCIVAQREGRDEAKTSRCNESAEVCASACVPGVDDQKQDTPPKLVSFFSTVRPRDPLSAALAGFTEAST